MRLKKYFTEKEGVGVLSTADNSGRVNSALYGRPHVGEKDTVSFIMRDKLTRANLLENENANYMFIEHEHGYKGVRMYLQKTGESQDKEIIESLARRKSAGEAGDEKRYLVTFRVEKVIALVGDQDVDID
jgi:hypothetical protein